MQFIDHASLGGKSISLPEAADAGRAKTAAVFYGGTPILRSNPVPSAIFATEHRLNTKSAFHNLNSPALLELLFPERPENYWSDPTAQSEQESRDGLLSCSGQEPNLNF